MKLYDLHCASYYLQFSPLSAISNIPVYTIVKCKALGGEPEEATLFDKSYALFLSNALIHSGNREFQLKSLFLAFLSEIMSLSW